MEEKIINEELIKGLEDTMINDTFRAVTYKNRMIQFQPVKMVNVSFVKFDDNDKLYIFENPSDERLKEGDKVLVYTSLGQSTATVYTSLKIQHKYLRSLMKVIGADHSKLKRIAGVYKQVTREEVVLLEGENND